MNLGSRGHCPVCLQRVEPTTRGNIGSHRDTTRRNTCPGSGQPFRITGVASDDGDHWMYQAACRGVDPELFYPDTGRGAGDPARAICEHCPVAADCLDYALKHQIMHGIYGGLTYKQRVELRRAS